MLSASSRRRQRQRNPDFPRGGSAIRPTHEFILIRTLGKDFLGATAAAYVSAICAYLLGMGFAPVFGAHWINFILGPPTFFIPVVSGVLVAVAFRAHLSWVSCFAWALPGLLFMRALLELKHAPNSTSSDIWNNLFRSDCSESECLYESLFTLPLISAISFSACSAWLTCRRKLKDSEVAKSSV